MRTTSAVYHTQPGLWMDGDVLFRMLMVEFREVTGKAVQTVPAWAT
jgi:phage tail protein X